MSKFAEKVEFVKKTGILPEAKGQLISKCPYEIIVSPIRPTKKVSEISVLASKERSNQKNRGTLLY